ncbi:MAG: hypothetical protein ACI4SS_03890, partial [Clostridia bacterium]
MKKLIPIIFALLIFWGASAVMAEDGYLSCELETNQPTVNYLVRRTDSVIPNLRYNNVTYIPLDSYYCPLLGIEVKETDDGIYIEKLDAGEDHYVKDAGSFEANMSEPVRSVEKTVYLCGKAYNNMSQEYPFARFNGVIYFPLTWQYAQDMGWTITFDEDGMRVYADNWFSTSYQDPTNIWSYDYTGYQVSGINCAKQSFQRSRFFSNCYLYLSTGKEFKEFNNHFFTNGLSGDMELNGNELAIEAYYYNCGHVPFTFSAYSYSSHEKYMLTIDVSEGKLTDTRLIDKIEKNMYGLLENMYGE